jgi:glycosyltransferase involved in cell wall biosynthesis
LSNDIQFYTSNKIKKTIQNSRIIYAVTKTDFQKLYKLNANTVNLLDVGATINETHKKRSYNSTCEKLRCIWVGRLDQLKALDILIEVINQSDLLKQNIELLIVGDGVKKNEYLSLVNKYNLNNIIFTGSVNKSTVNNLMEDSHVLIHTSIKEAASAVILEGLASGLPVICHDAFGMSHSITSTCGIKINFENKHTSILGFKNALETIIKNPILVQKFSEGAFKRAVELSWDGIINRISNDYSKLN